MSQLSRKGQKGSREQNTSGETKASIQLQWFFLSAAKGVLESNLRKQSTGTATYKENCVNKESAAGMSG
jgi:hypothetical protein